MARLQKKMLILKTGNTVPLLLQQGQDFEQWIIAECKAQNSHFITVSVHENEELPTLARIFGIIITGSPAYMTDQAPWNKIASDYLQQAHRQEIPMLGICYGHQLLAWSFGGEVDFHPAGREIGTVEIHCKSTVKDDPLFSGLPESFNAQVSHLQSVTKLPDGASLLASNDFEPHHGFRIGRNVWGVQFHPEFSSQVMAAYIEERTQDLLDEGFTPSQLHHRLAETPQSNDLLRRFYELASI